MNNPRRLLAALALAVAACSPEQVTDEHLAPVTLITIDVPALALGDRTPVTAMLSVGDFRRVLASGEYTVRSSDPEILEVTPQQVVIARREGTAMITASLNADTLVSFGRALQVGPPVYIGVRVTPPVGLIPGDSGTVAFVGYTRGGATIATPAGVTLESRSDLVEVQGAMIVARDTGSTWLVGTTTEGVRDSARVVIALGAPIALTIAPHDATVEVGDTVRIASRMVDRRLNDVILPVHYRSTNTTLATVDASGIVVARGAGTVRVIATHGVLADTLVTVVNGVPGSPPVEPPAEPPVEPPPPAGPPIDVTPPGAYVQVRLSGSPSPAVIAAFTSAAARLNAIIRSRGSAYDVEMFVPEGYCFATQPEIDQTVSGLLITASVGPIDGTGSVLGFAGPCLVRQGVSQVPVLGIMAFDEADMQYMASTGILGGVVLHEMMHVLGIGTLWGPAWQGLVASPQGVDPRFTGAQGRAAYTLLDALDAVNGVPVENSGGTGTRGSHWRESVFQTELMTGWAGGAMAMSRVTIAALADLGYDVDLSRADPYSLPSVQAGIHERGIEIADRVIAPKGTVDRNGRIN